MPNFLNLGRIGGDRDKMLRHRLFIAAQSSQRPLASRVSVCHCFQGCEGFRRDDEKCFRRVEVTDRFGKIGAINVGDKTESHGSIAVVLERLVGHDRTQVRAADADVNHIADALAGVSLPITTSHAVGKIRHPVEHGMDFRHHVLSVNDNGFVSRRAQSDVQDCALLGDVDFLAAEHGIDACSQARLFRQFQKESQGFIGDAVLGVIQVKTNSLDHQTFPALRIIRKKLPQMQL